MPPETFFHTPFGEFHLRRYPARRQEPLQAWSAADLLLLDEIHRLGVNPADTLVVNDEHGALCVPLQARALWTDSSLATLALHRNLTRNRRRDVPVVWSTADPPAGVQLVALRIPKHLPYFEYQLRTLSGYLAPGAALLAAGMDKHLSPGVAQLLEQCIGPTQRHRGRRKARLFSVTYDGQVRAPVESAAGFYCEELASELHALPNVFSRDRLDGGTRLLLAQLPRLEPVETLLDLACGNGVLGLAALKSGLAGELILADESAMAIASAKLNASRLMPHSCDAISFHQDDGLTNYRGPQPHLILCNPPFHLNHTVDEYAGRRLLVQSARHLPTGGRLCLVANRHLDYGPALRRYFRRVDQLARDRRFVVWLAQRR